MVCGLSGCIPNPFLSNVHVRYIYGRPSVCLSVVCRPSSVTLVHWPSVDIEENFYGDCPKGTPPSGKLNTTGVAKYSDLGPIEGYISETVQDRR